MSEEIYKKRAHELIDTLGLDDWSLLARLEELRFMYLKSKSIDVPADDSNEEAA